MDLPLIWAGLIAIAVMLYVLLDGFDLGVGFGARHLAALALSAAGGAPGAELKEAGIRFISVPSAQRMVLQPLVMV